MFFSFSLIMEELQTTLPKCVCCRLSPQILFKVTGSKIKDNKYIIDFIEECFTKLKNVHSFSKMLKTNISIDLSEKGSTGKRLLMSPESTSLVQPSSGMTKKKKKIVFFLQRNVTSLMTTNILPKLCNIKVCLSYAVITKHILNLYCTTTLT